MVKRQDRQGETQAPGRENTCNRSRQSQGMYIDMLAHGKRDTRDSQDMQEDMWRRSRVWLHSSHKLIATSTRSRVWLHSLNKLIAFSHLFVIVVWTIFHLGAELKIILHSLSWLELGIA